MLSCAHVGCKVQWRAAIKVLSIRAGSTLQQRRSHLYATAILAGAVQCCAAIGLSVDGAYNITSAGYNHSTAAHAALLVRCKVHQVPADA